MSLPTGYDPGPSGFRLLLKDLSDVEQYRYETSQILASGTPQQDFNVNGIGFHCGANSDFGWCLITIDDKDNALTNTGFAFRSSKIKRFWNVELYLGKTSAIVERWFYGKILEVRVLRPGTNEQELAVLCVGSAIIAKDRHSIIKRNQDKTADGETPDTTDTNAKTSEIMKDLVQDTDHIPYGEGLGAITALTVTGIEDIDIKKENFSANYQRVSQLLSQLASDSNRVWGVDADRDVFARDPLASGSGFLFSNNITDHTFKNWPTDKLGILLNSPADWGDSIAETGKSIIYGTGSRRPIKDVDNDPTVDASYTSLDTKYLAIKVAHNKDNLSKIAVKASKTGTPAEPLIVEIWGETAGGAPNPADFRASVELQPTKLQTLPGSGDWFEIDLNEEIPTQGGENLFIIFNENGDGTNRVDIDYKAATGTYYDSSDKTTWNSQTGDFAHRSYQTKSIKWIQHHNRARLRFGIREEHVTFRKDLTDETTRESLLSAGQFLGAERRDYSKVIIQITDRRIPIGKTAIIEDVKTGMKTKAIIMGLDVLIDANNNTNSLGASVVSLQLEEVLL